MAQYGKAAAKLPAAGVLVTKNMIDAAELIVAGYNFKEISKLIGVSARTIEQWSRQNEDFKALVNQLVEGLMQEIKVDLVVNAKRALNTLQELLQSENEQIRLSASKDILDRAGFKPANKQEVDVKQTVNYFANMSDEELAKFLDIKPDEVIDIESVEVTSGTDGTGEVGTVEEEK